MRSLRSYLDKGGCWVYQEIIFEALIVLWFASQISIKLGQRFFVEWQSSRVHPNAVTELDTFLQRFGFGINECIWDRTAYAWKKFLADPTYGSTRPSATAPAVGYYGTLLLYSTTALLAVSIVFSLFYNFHWRQFRWRHGVHICSQLTALLEFIEDLTGSVRWVGVIRLVLYGIWFLPGLVWVCCILVLCSLPLLAVTGIFVWVLVGLFDVEAVFPVGVGVVSLLAVHCTGRIWGWWMQETYFSRLFSSTTTTGRTSPTQWVATFLKNLFGGILPQSDLGSLNKLLDAPPVEPLTAERTPRLIFTMRAIILLNGCWAVHRSVSSLLAASTTPEKIANCTGMSELFWRTKNLAKGLDYPSAMLSYWNDKDLAAEVDEEDLGVLSFTWGSAGFGQMLGPVYSAWGTGLRLVTVLPHIVMCFLLGGCILLACMTACMDSSDGKYPKRAKLAKKKGVADSANSDDKHSRHNNIKDKPTKSRHHDKTEEKQLRQLAKEKRLASRSREKWEDRSLCQLNPTNPSPLPFPTASPFPQQRSGVAPWPCPSPTPPPRTPAGSVGCGPPWRNPAACARCGTC
ncbi:uncharacterized protein LOC129592890 [Paramacrobiotus metropolitanus]|uniref:uncharacterized protein LOC129592890 n=1 Tax=Paramacrobiotus metropolitanus TaxID=2943436 RepID=UPI0024456955|nr:uncharacterized protein LOC129592890 [Paramacrobiotus metropolitanus]